MHPKTIRLGGHEITRLGMGTNRLRHTDENIAFVRAAVEAGLGMVDTAHLYTGGASEATVGEALAPLPAAAVVATKGGFGAGEGRPEALRAQIDESLSRLRTDRIPLWYLHRVDPETPLEETLGVVREYVDAGRIGLVGLSEVSIGQIERARAIVPIAAVQNEYSLAVRKWDAVIDHCEREGICFVPFYPLRGEHDALAGIAGRHGATPTQVRLSWLLHRSPAMLPIPGTLALEHVRENLAALDLHLSDAELAALDDQGPE